MRLILKLTGEERGLFEKFKNPNFSGRNPERENKSKESGQHRTPLIL